MNKPLAIDLCCGLGGWAEGLLAEGWDVVGYDIERHDYGNGAYPGTLVLQDVLTIHGSQFKDADLIVASPPCQEYSYMAMPWSRAKAIAADYRAGRRDVKKLTALFDACFRIQREAGEAAGRHIPMVVENVRGAQPWVGRARWNFGSFYLWGDVPALMPITKRHVKVQNFRFDGSGKSFQTASVEAMKMPYGNRSRYEIQYAVTDDGVKGFTPKGQPLGKNELGRMCGSRSKARKAASAMIAKIPFALSSHIARVFKPREVVNQM